MLNQKDKEKGSLLIEILIAIAIISIALISLLGLAIFSLKTEQLAKINNEAINLVQEEIEAVRNFRDNTDWETEGLGFLNAGVDYSAQKTGDIPPRWNLVLGEETIDIFKRKVVFSDVMRDSNDNIVESGGTDDPETKKATVTISWQEKSIEIITYFTKWKD